MRIRIVKRFAPSNIDPRSDRFQTGFHCEVNGTVGRFLIDQGLAEEIVAEEHGLVVPQNVPSLNDAIAADIALDDAIAAAIER
jgi:hypothetical protein